MSDPSGPFTRSSTVLELSSTLIGRTFKYMIIRQLPPAKNEEERKVMEEFTVGLPLESLVEMSEGKLTWDVVDSVLDLANRKPYRAVPRVARAVTGKVMSFRPTWRP